jgi:hypothetical protein
MFMMGLGAAAAALPIQTAAADPVPETFPLVQCLRLGVPGPACRRPGVPVPGRVQWPAGAPPDPAWWFIVPARETIKNPVEWDKPFNMGRYVTDQEHVFQDGNGNLVIRATRGPATTSRRSTPARRSSATGAAASAPPGGPVKLNCLTSGAWPAFWLLNDDPVRGGEDGVVRQQRLRAPPCTLASTASFATDPHPVDSAWHNWRMTWLPTGMYFWKDYQPGMPPFFVAPELDRRLAVQRSRLYVAAGVQRGGRRIRRTGACWRYPPTC